MRRFLSTFLMLCVLVGSSVVITSAQEATPAATPIQGATPVATPIAVTPIQGATPVATPVQAATPAGAEAIEVLFVQSAPNSTITPLLDAASGATHELALTGGGNVDQAAYVGDRPNRTVGTIPHTDVMDLIGVESGNPPKAVLVAQTPDGSKEVVVVEIISGVVHVTGDMVYRVSLLTDDTGLDLELEGEPVSVVTDVQNYDTSHLFIFIDDLCHPGRPC